MTKQSFFDSIRSKLKSENIPDKYIDQQIDMLDRKISDLPPETADKFVQESSIQTITDKLIMKYNIINEADKSSGQQEPSDFTRTVELNEVKDKIEFKEIKAVSDDPEPGKAEKVSDADAEQGKPERDQQSSSDSLPSERAPQRQVSKTASSDMVVIFDDDKKKKKSSALSTVFAINSTIYEDNAHPNLTFWLLFILLAPAGILAAAVFLGIYIAILAALAGVILVIVGAVVAISGVGSLISIASLLYGATQVISVPRYVGLYEIGFGLLVGGITMFAGIALYNIALRLVPFIYSKLLKLIGFTVRKLRAIFKKSRKGCEKL